MINRLLGLVALLPQPLIPFWLQLTLGTSLLGFSFYMLGHTSGVW